MVLNQNVFWTQRFYTICSEISSHLGKKWIPKKGGENGAVRNKALPLGLVFAGEVVQYKLMVACQCLSWVQFWIVSLLFPYWLYDWGKVFSQPPLLSLLKGNK